MKIRVECETRFDITVTGIRNNYRANQIPCRTQDGRDIYDQTQWIHARNQQRNWDTVNQIISLRCLPENISMPQKFQRDGIWFWRFEFDVMDAATVSESGDSLSLLKSDSVGVPMITGLDETPGLESLLDPQQSVNIKFQVIQDKY